MKNIIFRIKHKSSKNGNTDGDWLDLGPYLRSIEYRCITEYAERYTMGQFGSIPVPVGSRGELSLDGFFPPESVTMMSLFSEMQIYSNEFEWISCTSVMSGNACVRQKLQSCGPDGLLRWKLELLVSNVQRKPLEEQKIPELVVPKIGIYGRRIQGREAD